MREIFFYNNTLTKITTRWGRYEEAFYRIICTDHYTHLIADGELVVNGTQLNSYNQPFN